MIIGGTPVPKRALIQLIRKVFPADEIRAHFHIQPETNIGNRLQAFKKKDLLTFIDTTEDGKTALAKTKAAYPLTNSPTLYLVHVNRWPDESILQGKADTLAVNQRVGGIQFGHEKTIPCVYMITSLNHFSLPDQLFTEIPLVYEKAIEYRIADPTSEDYGGVDEVISLEHAFIWYCRSFNHALLACTDYVAIKPILTFGRIKFNIDWELPNLSEEMLLRLAQNADPRTASFGLVEDNPDDPFDANNVTVSDTRLGDRRTFHTLSQNSARQQTSGFYVNHPGTSIGGIGITRRYGRIWTPVKMNKDQILGLATTIINSTEEELKKEYDRDVHSFIAYYNNYDVKVQERLITGEARKIFDTIIISIVQAQKRAMHEASLDIDSVSKILAVSKGLDLVPVLICNCPMCTEHIILCPDCNTPLGAKHIDGKWVFCCTACKSFSIEDGTTYSCDCGEQIEITYSTDIRVLPGADFLRAVYEFSERLQDISFDDSFIIIGRTLRLISLQKHQTHDYLVQLSDFHKWSQSARIQYQNPPQSKIKDYLRILGRIKEKCKINNSHPKQSDCDVCKKSKISRKRIEDGKYMCLSRLFGIAINEFFDGIHHGYEGADIQYEDNNQNITVKVGVHLKSRNPNVKKPIGRGKKSIKGLYAQYCYSIFQVAQSILDEDIMGISIPNVIAPDVLASFRFLAEKFQIPILILQEAEWIRILHTSLEVADLSDITQQQPK